LYIILVFEMPPLAAFKILEIISVLFRYFTQ
jgi:hypothetical protein